MSTSSRSAGRHRSSSSSRPHQERTTSRSSSDRATNRRTRPLGRFGSPSARHTSSPGTSTIPERSSTWVLRRSEFALVSLALYDAVGDVLDAQWTYADLDEISAGGSSPFDVILPEENTVGSVRAGVTGQAYGIDDFVYHTTWNNYFDDVGLTSFRPDIVWNAEQGITTGCGPGLFCPTANVPRDQMASFLSRALDLSGPAANAYNDDNGNIHEPNINLVAREGIASGCAAGKYCPTAFVARDQMASFLSRALDLSGPAANAYSDDNGNIHEPNINLVARDGIASGAGAASTARRPRSPVARWRRSFIERSTDRRIRRHHRGLICASTRPDQVDHVARPGDERPHRRARDGTEGHG